jgi:hypothetical protein
MFYEWQQKVEKCLGKMFERYGRFIAKKLTVRTKEERNKRHLHNIYLENWFV